MYLIIIRIIVLLACFPLVQYLTIVITNILSHRCSKHISMLVSHTFFYSATAFIIVGILQECGFNVAALLGAAGIVGIAVGFASQASIANVISGIFLLLERPFSIGDTIKSGEITGTVEAIDLMAIRVKTADNRLVRIPNESVLKQSLITITYYEKRRLDLVMSVPYSTGNKDLIEYIKTIIATSPLCMKMPVPTVLIHKIGPLPCDIHIRIFFSIRVWVANEKFSQATGELMKRLSDECIGKDIIITLDQVN